MGDDQSLKARIEGNAHQNSVEREADRAGLRSPNEIPVQGTPPSLGYKAGTVDPNSFRPSIYETGGRYRLGPPQRPNIVHDNGHSGFPRRAPTADDYAALALWKGKLEVAEAVRPDLTDACAAYRHFLEGRGKTRLFSYDRYVASDQSGRHTLRSAILEFQYAAVELSLDHPDLEGFQFTGPAIPCGVDASKQPYLGGFYPYPATENWQKTIGGHFIWLSGTVEVIESPSGRPPAYRGVMDVHAEDRYNFNPGDEDIATGIPDSANGRFEITGLGHQYNNHSSLRRVLSWTGFQLGVHSAAASTARSRQPSDNRRARNRL
jgi:hypothetical protein